LKGHRGRPAHQTGGAKGTHPGAHASPLQGGDFCRESALHGDKGG